VRRGAVCGTGGAAAHAAPAATATPPTPAAPTAGATATVPQGDAAADPALQEIAKVREGLVDAFNRKDVDKLLSYLHPDVVVTWQNSEVSKGREAVKAYYSRMMIGEDRVVDSINAAPVIDGRNVVGDTSISFGHMNDTFRLRDGMEFRLDSRFSAWLTRENGQWLVHGFHLSGNIFENQIQATIVKKASMWAGVIGLLVGLVAGALVGRMMRRKAAAG
jgi:ketosteroid isomerase-like protein